MSNEPDGINSLEKVHSTLNRIDVLLPKLGAEFKNIQTYNNFTDATQVEKIIISAEKLANNIERVISAGKKIP